MTTTSHPSLRAPGLARLSPAPVGWATVVALAAVMTLADCFVLTSVQGAVGAIERAQHPFAFWFRTSAVLLPVFVLAVLVALAVARRIAGPVLRTPVRVMVAALLIVLAGSVVGSGAMVVSAAYDYQLQSAQGLTRMDMAVPVDPSACTGVCAAQQSQFDVDQRAARLGSVLVLGANLVAVGWLVALRGGRLERTGPGGRRRPAAERRVRTA